MTDQPTAAHIYRLCADAIRGEIVRADRAALSSALVSTRAEAHLIKRLTPILTRWEILASQYEEEAR